MKVLYVSKASRVASHREKLRVLGQRVEVTLVTPERWGDKTWEPAPFDQALDIGRLPTLFHGRNHLHLYRGLGRVVDTDDFDLIHVDEEPYSLVTHQVAGLAARRAIPFVYFAWQNLDKALPPPFPSVRRRVFRRAAAGIAGTPQAARVLRSAGFEGPLCVSPQMGVSLERFRPDPDARRDRRRELGLDEDTPLVGFVGRLVPEKGVDLLLDAAARTERVHLVLVGGGPERQRLLRQASGSGLAGRLHLPGHVPSLAVPRWTAAFDLLALPSRTTRRWMEQFGRAVVEAMACEVPVVVSDSGALPEVVGDGGRVVAEGSARELTRAIASLLDDPAARHALGRAGRIRVRERFSHRAVVEDQVALYRRLLWHR